MITLSKQNHHSHEAKDAQLEGYREVVMTADNSLPARDQDSTLFKVFHLRDLITRFDHESIRERVVHSCGAGACGHFQVTQGFWGSAPPLAARAEALMSSRA